MDGVSGAGRIGSVLATWTRLVLRHRAATVAGGLALAVFAMYFAALNLGINTDTADMISPSLSWRQDYTAFRDRFAIRDRNIVIVVDAAIAEDAGHVANAIAAVLRESPELFGGVLVPGAGEFFDRFGLLYLSTDDLEALGDRLAAAQPLIGRLVQRFSGAELTSILGDMLDRGIAEAGAQRPFDAVAGVVEAAAEGERRTLSWQALFAGEPPGTSRRFVLLQPWQDFSSPRPAAAAIGGIRAALGVLEASFPEGVRVRVTGTVAMEHEEMTSVTRGASVAGLAALLLVATVLYAALRSIRLLIVSLATLIAGLSLTAAFAAASVVDLNLISVAFAVLYVGLGVDFILHICLRFNELRSSGLGTDDALVATVGGVGESLVICAVTTAAGFYAFMPTAFSGVSELGLISGTGMFLSLAVSVTLLPPLISLMSAETVAVRRPWIGTSYLAFATRSPRRVIAVAIAIAAGTAMLIPRAGFDRNPINLRDPGTESVATMRALASDGDAGPLNMVAVAPDDETADEWASALRELDEVDAVTTAAALIPAEQESKLLLLEDLQLLLGPGFAELEAGEPDPDSFLAGLEGLAERLERDSSAGSGRLASALGGLLARVRPLPGVDRAAALSALEADLLRTLPGQLMRLAAGLEPGPLDPGVLPPELRDRWIAADGTRLIEISPAIDVADSAGAERFTRAVRDVLPTATGLPVVYEEAGRTVVRSFQLAFAYALAFVSVTLLIFLRRLGDSLLVLVPVLLAAGVTVAATVVLGIEFNFANVIALPLLLGVGVDNGIHIVHRMRKEPPASGLLSDTSTSRAVLASGLTTVASFGNLAFASHLGMASMGQVLTTGMLATLAATLVLLPALLVGRASA
ncbi:MAG TPA: MMPL family transporter [Gammaproteobacteria bacterium]